MTICSSELSFLNTLFKKVQRPSREDLRRMSEKYGVRTAYGSYNYYSMITARSVPFTAIISKNKRLMELSNQKLADPEIVEKADETVRKVHEYLNSINPKNIIAVEGVLGNDSEMENKCRMFVSLMDPRNVELGHIWSEMTFPVPERMKNKRPDSTLVFIPEIDISKKRVLVFPDEQVTYILGLDYTGEAKKGHLRQWMYNSRFKSKIGIGLHAGSQFVRVWDENDKRFKKFTLLFFGLSGTGKSTRSCSDNNLIKKGEKVSIKQDDIVVLRPDGATLGSENNFYIKTDGLEPKYQEVLYKAATKSKKTIFENTRLRKDGTIDFSDDFICGNGRAVIYRENFGKYYDRDINTPPLKEIDGLILFFITRAFDIIPACIRLNPEQTAMVYMVGESVDTPATTGDSTKWGKLKRVPGTDPFNLGDMAECGNFIHDLCLKFPRKVMGFQLNTGGVGAPLDREKGYKTCKKVIQIKDMNNIINSILRGKAEFVEFKPFDTQTIVKANGNKLTSFDPRKYYTENEYSEAVKKFRFGKGGRLEHLRKFNPKLHKEIINSV